MNREQAILALVEACLESRTGYVEIAADVVIHGRRQHAVATLGVESLVLRIDGLPSSMTGDARDLAGYVVSLFGEDLLSRVLSRTGPRGVP